MTRTIQSYTGQYRSIAALHRRGGGGVRVAASLTRRLEGLIQSVFATVDAKQRRPIAVVALGGFGRRELCFASDVDIMFLIDTDEVKPVAGRAVQTLLHRLLDHGLDIGHSFRTIAECLEFSGGDLESWISLLESRFLCGNRSVFARYRKALRERVRSYDRRAFATRLLESIEARHAKYGTSTKLLEPNVKNSAGGLRDLHAILWMLRGTGYAAVGSTPPNAGTATSGLLGSSFMERTFDSRLLRDARRALDFLLRTRNEMHLQGIGLRDTLEFSLQRRVAEALRYRSTHTRTSVELFMRDYYIAARAVARLAERVTGWTRTQLLPPAAPAVSEQVDDLYELRGATLHFHRKPARLTNEDALRVFLHAADRRAGLSNDLEDLLARRSRSFSPLRKRAETDLFRTLLNRPHGVSAALQRMNDLGLLERWIPEWRGLVAFFQHNVYHYYTADEHTLTALAHAEALHAAHSPFGDVFRALPRRDTLYLACLFHDIAKPMRIGDHEITGVTMAETILKRLHYTDTLPDVTFLIRHHLLMEQVAFRRNVSDPQTVIDFAARFKSPHQLDLLYLLTYADLSAVNRNVWTDWKGMLLHELYRRTRQILERQMTSEEYTRAAHEERLVALKDLMGELSTGIPREDAVAHLNGFDNPAYLESFDAAEIAEHLRQIWKGETVSSIFRRKGEFTEVTIIARDAPYLLSKLCGVLTANDANILDARIFTRNDGVVIDKFRVMDFISKSALSEDQCRKIRTELVDVLAGALNIQDLLHRHRMKWRRRARVANPNIRIDVEFEEHPRYTIIDVYAPDMLGFLYKITETISNLGLTISFAKIATRVDGIVDSFYVLDLTGNKIDDLERCAYVKGEILQTIDELTRSELVVK